MNYLTWDNIIIAALISGTLLGFLLRKAEVVIIVVSLSLAHIFTEELGHSMASLLRSMTGNYIPLFYIRIPLFIVVLVTLATEQHLLDNALSFPMGIKNNAEGAFWGFAASGILLTSVFSFLEESQRVSLFSESYLATVLNLNRVFFVVIPIALIMGSSLMRRFKIGAKAPVE